MYEKQQGLTASSIALCNVALNQFASGGGGGRIPCFSASAMSLCASCLAALRLRVGRTDGAFTGAVESCGGVRAALPRDLVLAGPGRKSSLGCFRAGVVGGREGFSEGESLGSVVGVE